jgi:hypothetical protein
MLWLLPGDGQMLTGAMLIHDFVQVDRAYDEVRARVLADPRALIAACAGSAYRYGERLSLRLTPLNSHPAFGKTVDVDLADPYEREDRLVLPMHWWAPGATRLYPHLDGDPEFAPLGARSTQITLMGRATTRRSVSSAGAPTSCCSTVSPRRASAHSLHA